MELFRSPPKYSPSFALEEISSELAFKEVAEEDPAAWLRVYIGSFLVALERAVWIDFGSFYLLLQYSV